MKKINAATFALVIVLVLSALCACSDKRQKQADKILPTVKENSDNFELYIGMKEADFPDVSAYTREDGDNMYKLVVDEFTYYEVSPYPTKSDAYMVTKCVTTNKNHLVFGFNVGSTLLEAYNALDKHAFESLELYGTFMQSHVGFFYIDTYAEADTSAIKRIELYLNNNPTK